MVNTPSPRPSATTLRPVTLSDIHNDEVIRALLLQADVHLAAVGAPESGLRHHELVSQIAHDILQNLGRPERICELAAIAGYMHDIGNVVCNQDHPITGGAIALRLLQRLEMDIVEATEIAAAIANHDVPGNEPVSDVNAALIIANFADVHRSRVRNQNPTSFTPFDRVNFAVVNSIVRVVPDEQVIQLELTIDTSISPVLDYFNLYLARMIVSRRAAQFLNCSLSLNINGNRML